MKIFVITNKEIYTEFKKKFKTHKYCKIERFKKNIVRILLLFLFLKNMKNIRFYLNKKTIKLRYLNINYKILK